MINEVYNKLSKNYVLVVDDDAPIGSLLKMYLGKYNYEVKSASSVSKAIHEIEHERPDVIISDIRISGESGIDLLCKVKEIDSSIPVIIITGFPSLDNAIDALKFGASDYIVKPFNLSDLRSKIEQVIEVKKLSNENMILKEMASLHKITRLLLSTQNLNKLLTIIMEQCKKISNASSGLIVLSDSLDKNLVAVRNWGNLEMKSISQISNTGHWPVIKWVYYNKQPLFLRKGESVSGLGLSITRNNNSGYTAAFPMINNKKVIGVIYLNNKEKDFLETTLKVIHVLASQAGVAINNSRLYNTLSEQLDGLTFISKYSEKLMEKVEENEIINLFFNTLNAFCRENITFAAILTIAKGKSNILYWSKIETDNDKIKNFIIDNTYSFDETYNISAADFKIKRFNRSPIKKEKLTLNDMQFNLSAPLIIRNNWFGGIVISAQSEDSLSKQQKDLLPAILGHARTALINSKLYDEMKEDYLKTIKALAVAVDAKDKYTGGHSEHVSEYAGMIAREMKLDKKSISNIVNAGLLHDVGKIGIPGHILNKPGLLTADEFNNIMKTHSELGANIIKEVPFLKDLYPLILYHHEYYNGTGYPEGLSGEAIPLGARILAVADAYDAMTSDRPYRKSLGKKEACRRLWYNRGTQFDADVTDIFLSIKDKLDND